MRENARHRPEIMASNIIIFCHVVERHGVIKILWQTRETVETMPDINLWHMRAKQKKASSPPSSSRNRLKRAYARRIKMRARRHCVAPAPRRRVGASLKAREAAVKMLVASRKSPQASFGIRGRIGGCRCNHTGEAVA